jgi:coenzyme F420-reducing hydrogenase alpha subunit
VSDGAAKKGSQTIKVNYLARVEGEGALRVRLRGGRVEDVKLEIFEPPRLFEAFLRGRHFQEVADITARICGICPVAYQMSAVQALERALGVAIDPAVRLLRRLFYCGEWIESHALHVFLLHAPDFLGFQDALEMAREHRDLVEPGLRIKKIGNQLVTLLGGREIHPISVAVGGFYRVPTRRELAGIAEDLKWALEAALAAARRVAGFEFPDFEPDYEFVALSHPEEYALNEGRLISNLGLDIAPEEFEDHFVERHVKHSNALQCQVRHRGSYLVGPLARFNLNYDKLPEVARQAARDGGLSVPCRNPFRSIVVRAVEMVFACAEALRILKAYEPPAAPRCEAAPRAGAGAAITEAPRGVLYHRYEIDGGGLIRTARIIPPTSQNQKRMEEDLGRLLPQFLDRPAKEITWRAEQAIRNYDPCISCATHFLKLRVERV